ncbi:alpha/beta-hydrolase family protein [Devosia sp. MSA67]|uniref:Alpha/beta-hydrolase family protein n=2 Tax=Devosia sediminis TaxID=2798801 RepID=A0A934IQL7_9HYPH|nr:alpha/beta-hydrolase family protein [Devosia sediminis]
MSLTPSLLPRAYLVQGVVSGVSFAAGYAIGAVIQWIWEYLGLRWPAGKTGRWLGWGIGIVTAAITLFSLYQTTGWQNAVRAAMNQPPADNTDPFLVVLVALVPALMLVAVGTVLVLSVRFVSRKLFGRLPRRVSFLLSLVAVGVTAAVLFNGVLLQGGLRAADAFFQQLDAIATDGTAPPANPNSSGSAQSLVAWETIGRDGRTYVETGPTQADIEAMTGRPAMEPLRTYVSMRSAPTVEGRAQMALEEMLRIGSFDRSILVIATPVGTGWVDPASMDSVEYLWDGDIASVALQYSYLISPLSLVVEPDYGREAAQALFNAVYGYWRTLPPDDRPELWLSGLSLGAHNSQASTNLYSIVGDPINGALWAGPPFTSRVWRDATSAREPGSPEWRPVLGDSTTVRFGNNGQELLDEGGEWGPIRVAFIQYPSDPIVFFSFASLVQTPAWMIGERGPGVTPELHWYPVATLLQLGMDMALGLSAPVGYGHKYSASHYTDTWLALTEPPGWDEARLAALKQRLSDEENARWGD